MSELSRTPLYDLHLSEGAKMVPFAGYDMPVQYSAGVMKEHLHTRTAAGLFDVSHMGQVILRPKSGVLADAQAALETLVPVSILALAEGRQRYALFTNDAGGIMDDLMVANRGDHLLLVVNAACKENDIAHLQENLSGACEIQPITDRSLVALQGPSAEAALESLVPGAAAMKFMDSSILDWSGVEVWVSRSGYTGEDGYEISVPNTDAEKFARSLLDIEAVAPIGLGARDSLRLEAGLCLYGSDLDTTTSPVEAALEWAVQKVRRNGGDRAGGFPGADRIIAEFEKGAGRRRVGLLPEGRAPMRAGTEIFSGDRKVGVVTSGAYGPSIERAMSMGYVTTDVAETGTTLEGEVRGKRMAVTVADMPFRPSTYKR
ncbi:MAG: glycine cleavage system aminomethyltransferase GcvT [Boseongicola sp.]|nr:MAG: glycine cleavage system aminomethyltransferase GcvT [Boseongicola sp.]